MNIDSSQRVVRMAELVIDPVQSSAYESLLSEEIETSVRLEPGVLMLHAVKFKDDPGRVCLLEVYASQAAYELHLSSPHFLKYKTETEAMVISLELHETVPIRLCAKPAGE